MAVPDSMAIDQLFELCWIYRVVEMRYWFNPTVVWMVAATSVDTSIPIY